MKGDSTSHEKAASATVPAVSALTIVGLKGENWQGAPASSQNAVVDRV